MGDADDAHLRFAFLPFVESSRKDITHAMCRAEEDGSRSSAACAACCKGSVEE